jgi:uncharacterized SAM-dependent methyltransferase
MRDFNCLVSEQMKTMDKLLYLQSELERNVEIEQKLQGLNQISKLENVQTEINRVKLELQKIHQEFERQTEEVIRSYQENAIC